MFVVVEVFGLIRHAWDILRGSLELEGVAAEPRPCYALGTPMEWPRPLKLTQWHPCFETLLAFTFVTQLSQDFFHLCKNGVLFIFSETQLVASSPRNLLPYAHMRKIEKYLMRVYPFRK